MASIAKKPKLRKQYISKWKDQYHELFPCITRYHASDTKAWCTICGTEFSIGNRGRCDITTHINRPKHQTRARSVAGAQTESIILTKSDQLQDKIIRAEALYATYIVEHNIALSAADHFTEIAKIMFDDSSIAKGFASKRKKTTAIIHELSAIKKESLIEYAQTWPYSLSTDGGSGNSSKIYPMILYMYNPAKEMVCWQQLALPVIKGRATGVNIYELCETVLKDNGISADMLLAFSCDNTNTMVGHLSGVYGLICQKMQPQCHLSGCLCHLCHLTAQTAAAELYGNPGDILVSMYYYMKKSDIRKDTLADLQEFYGTGMEKVIKHGWYG
jgi:hypothetical protein